MKDKIKQLSIPMIKIISFCILFIFIFTIISYLQKPDDINLENISGLYGEKDNSLDVVYIGGSACFVYYAPLKAWEDYGIVSYDYAVNAVQIDLYKNMIKEVLKTQNPKLIIIDARAFSYRDGYEKSFDVSYRNVLTGMRFSKNKIESVNQIKDNIKEDKLSYYFDLIKYHRQITFNGTNLKMMIGKYKMPYNGFALIPKYAVAKQENFITNETKSLSEVSNKILIDLLEYMKETNVKYLFTVSPYVEKIEDKKIYNYIQSIIEEYGYDFIDANEYVSEIGLNFEKDFYNDGHVNIYGAEKYTDFISNIIIDNYNITNHKSDNEYDYMNRYIQKWHKEVRTTKTKINKIMLESE